MNSDVLNRIGKTGLIVTGDTKGFFIKIQDDLHNTGGYLILYWKDSPKEGYDDWVSKDDLPQYFLDHPFEINWD